MSVLLIYIRWSTPLTIHNTAMHISEFTYVPASSSLTYTIDGQVLTPKSINYVIKEMSLYCDTIAIGDTSYKYKPIWNQLSINRLVSPRGSESGISYTHWVCNGLTIVANDSSLNMTTFY